MDTAISRRLVFLGLAGMQDPLRPEVPAAVRACAAAGLEVAMVTGDDPRTARAIATEAGLVFADDQVVTGDAIRQAEAGGAPALDALTRKARVYARVDPTQKLAIVLSLARNGHFVAVTGDGVNDAPALKHAHVGVAMGRKGTDVARESADIIITDDNFASIVAGIREGRVAYANIRKVIFMSVSTGVAEVLLFLLAIPLGLPMPLLPVQLLWLNLVTNGIQDVALAAEKAEGRRARLPAAQPARADLRSGDDPAHRAFGAGHGRRRPGRLLVAARERPQRGRGAQPAAGAVRPVRELPDLQQSVRAPFDLPAAADGESAADRRRDRGASAADRGDACALPC